MVYKQTTVALAMLGGIAAATPAAAMGAIGCTNLPDYERAVGTIENGPQSCGMSTEEARRILAAHGYGGAAPAQPAAPAPYRHRRHHRHTPPER